jgi:methanogenic corrinoid protein MtbC1
MKRSDDNAWETDSDTYPRPEARSDDNPWATDSDTYPRLNAKSEVRALAVRPSRANLLNIIEDQIIPQLLLAHRSALISGALPADIFEISEDEIERFAELSAGQDMAGLLGRLEGLLREGLPIQNVLLDVIAPAAHLLGEQWLDDERSFSDVTVGLGTLQRLVAVIGQKVEAPVTKEGLVVLSAAPGEQHTLSIHVLAELLRTQGWAVRVEPAADEMALLELVGRESVSAIGFTVSNDALVRHLGPLLERIHALQPRTQVMLGGAAAGLSEVAERFGAWHCRSGRDALDCLGSAAASSLPNRGQ